MKKITFRIVIAVVIAALVFIAAFFIRKSNKNRDIDNQTFTVKQEIYENIIEISGNISAAESQTLQAAGEGTVQKVYVKEGDFVKKGQKILELDAVEENYNLAKLAYEMEQTRINGSRRQYALMQTQYSVLKSKIEKRQVIAHFDGIIIELSVSEGDVVEAKDEVGIIINRDYMTAKVEIVESDVSKLKMGQTVKFTFPAYEDLPVEGYVESFPAVGRVSSRGATVVDAVVRIDNPPDEILPNFSFTGKIEITAPEKLLVVERQGIGYKDRKPFAEKVLPDGQTVQVAVKVVPYDANYVRIESGLEENDVIKSQGALGNSGRLRVSSSKQKSSSSRQGGGMGVPMGGGMMSPGRGGR